MADLSHSLQFGVELELLLGCRSKAFSNWKSFAKEVSRRLTKVGIANHVGDGAAEAYDEWAIVQEVTVPSNPAKNLWAVELVSPIYPIHAPWAADLDAIFLALAAFFTLTPSPTCSTHVHISTTPDPFSSTELARLAQALLRHEKALDSLMPPARRGSAAYWCQSNRANPSLRNLPSVGACIAAIDDALAACPWDDESERVAAVVAAVNLFPARSAYGRAHGATADFVRGKVYKWNLGGMMPESGGLGTVEFRQAPGSGSAEEAAAWVTLAAAFVAGAVVGAGEENRGGLEELWGVLVGGGMALGWEGLGGVEDMFMLGN